MHFVFRVRLNPITLELFDKLSRARLTLASQLGGKRMNSIASQRVLIKCALNHRWMPCVGNPLWQSLRSVDVRRRPQD